MVTSRFVNTASLDIGLVLVECTIGFERILQSMSSVMKRRDSFSLCPLVTTLGMLWVFVVIILAPNDNISQPLFAIGIYTVVVFIAFVHYVISGHIDQINLLRERNDLLQAHNDRLRSSNYRNWDIIYRSIRRYRRRREAVVDRTEGQASHT